MMENTGMRALAYLFAIQLMNFFFMKEPFSPLLLLYLLVMLMHTKIHLPQHEEKLKRKSELMQQNLFLLLRRASLVIRVGEVQIVIFGTPICYHFVNLLIFK